MVYLILLHSWIGAGKSTLLDGLLKDVDYSKYGHVIEEHNITDDDHKVLLSAFYQGHFSPTIWEAWQLLSYWDTLMKDLRAKKDKLYLFSDRSVVDVMNFVSLHDMEKI